MYNLNPTAYNQPERTKYKNAVTVTIANKVDITIVLEALSCQTPYCSANTNTFVAVGSVANNTAL
jgi:hypothetical protein